MRLRQKILFSIIAVMGINLLLVLTALMSVQGRRYLSERARRRDTARNLLAAAVRRLPAGGSLDDVVADRAGELGAVGLLGRRWVVRAPDGRVLMESTDAFPGGADADAPDYVFTIETGGEGEYVVRGVWGDAPGPTRMLEGLDMLLAAMGVGTVALTAVVYLLLSRLVLDPVDDLVRASRRLAQGEPAFARPPPPRPDEVGALVRAFGEMAAEVRETRNNLEARVRAATERVEAAQRQLAFQERLAATGRLAAGIAHEINNPLGGCINAATRLREGDLPPERRDEYLALILEGLERMRAIVARVLEFARREPAVAPVDPAAPLRKALAFCRHRLEKQGVAIRDEAPEALPPVRADAGELQQVFLNLLQNATDAMPDGGQLTLAAEATDAEIVLIVRDTGVGMTPEEISAGFDLFHTTKPPGEGTGLGLSIAHNTVTRYGGTLVIESAKGEGATARVALPRADEEAEGAS